MGCFCAFGGGFEICQIEKKCSAGAVIFTYLIEPPISKFSFIPLKIISIAFVWYSKNAVRFNISVLAFYLMPNHYHFLMHPDGADDGISKCLGYSFNSYSQALNKQHGGHGPLFQDRFKAVGIDRVDLLIHVCRYIHLNPVKAGLVKTPEEWPYSDYADWVGVNEASPIKPA